MIPSRTVEIRLDQPISNRELHLALDQIRGTLEFATRPPQPASLDEAFGLMSRWRECTPGRLV
jgi:hypothetical protein